ncbi:Hypothetical predicted protein [Cloeon dipterum]|uniref:Otopetrin n=1 Tax=Cloeon dipterum TaxID=197152 RepID=A0A8S1CXS0_9INSE|nr:Hypothetical predicted protein [Cloeon dipterum]
MDESAAIVPVASTCPCCNHAHTVQAAPTPPTSSSSNPAIPKSFQATPRIPESAITPSASASNIPQQVQCNTRASLSGSQVLLNSITGGLFSGDRRASTAWGSRLGLNERRPSSLLQMGNCGACGEQRRYLISILRGAQQQQTVVRSPVVLEPPTPMTALQKAGPNSTGNNSSSLVARSSTPPPPSYNELPARGARKERKIVCKTEKKDDGFSAGLSALYAKLLVVLGIALPVGEVLSDKVPATFDQIFYLYLYAGSLLFMMYMYATLLRERAAYSMVSSYSVDVEGDQREIYVRAQRRRSIPVMRYGSFYLRASAIAFGIGSMIYSGLEVSKYIELEYECRNILLALTPGTRMVLTIVQIQFIFLNNRIEMGRYKLIARFGLMHMVATNLCEWLYVLVEETKHEIHLLTHISHNTSTFLTRHDRAADLSGECTRYSILGSLVENASPYLFPCTIEYSLICAVILYEMWHNVHKVVARKKEEGRDDEKVNMHHFSVDCSGAHSGLFSGIIVLVVTAISLIMFFVLIREPTHADLAVFQVTMCELVLYALTSVAVLVCMIQMRSLEYRHGPQALDCVLIVVAQTGMYVYCLFSILGSYLSPNAPGGGFLAELVSLLQTTCQTIFILDAWWRRSENPGQVRKKPGRQLVTFLLAANLAMWTINSLEKNRAEFRPTHLEFYGVWAWTIITHVSMPLAVYYRFHSTVCLLEIWKTAYKLRPAEIEH